MTILGYSFQLLVCKPVYKQACLYCPGNYFQDIKRAKRHLITSFGIPDFPNSDRIVIDTSTLSTQNITPPSPINRKHSLLEIQVCGSTLKEQNPPVKSLITVTGSSHSRNGKTPFSSRTPLAKKNSKCTSDISTVSLPPFSRCTTAESLTMTKLSEDSSEGGEMSSTMKSRNSQSIEPRIWKQVESESGESGKTEGAGGLSKKLGGVSRPRSGSEICRKHNLGLCTFPTRQCRYKHACLACRGTDHVTAKCPKTAK